MKEYLFSKERLIFFEQKFQNPVLATMGIKTEEYKKPQEIL